MDIKQIRVLVEINHDVQFSRFKDGDSTGGVQPLDAEMITVVKVQLEEALLHLEKLSNRK